jgi:hypothetical protein
MNMLDPKFTDNFLDGLKGSFRFVGKNHLKGAWAYWLLGVTVAFAGTMLYVANLNGQFMQSQGARTFRQRLPRPSSPRPSLILLEF